MFLRNSIGSYPKGISPYGVLDMAVNVEEWTSTLGKDYPYDPNDGREDLATADHRVVRGGSYFKNPSVRSASRYRVLPDAVLPGSLGFRVVVSSPGF